MRVIPYWRIGVCSRTTLLFIPSPLNPHDNAPFRISLHKHILDKCLAEGPYSIAFSYGDSRSTSVTLALGLLRGIPAVKFMHDVCVQTTKRPSLVAP